MSSLSAEETRKFGTLLVNKLAELKKEDRIFKKDEELERAADRGELTKIAECVIFNLQQIMNTDIVPENGAQNSEIMLLVEVAKEYFDIFK